MNVDLEIVENIFIDWKKKDVNPIDKANLLNLYMKEKRIGQRELARRLGVSHSVVQDWCMWSKMTKEKYVSLERDGISKTDMYKLLRNNKRSITSEELKEMVYTDKVLTKFISEIAGLRTKKDFSNETIFLIKRARDELNHLEMYYDKQKRF